MINRQQKEEIIKDLADKLSRQKVVIFSDYTGLSVNQAQQLRQRLREQGADYQVAKKTLIDLALKEAGFKDIQTKELNGQISMTFGYQDEVLPAKILYQFSQEKQTLKILSGLVNGQYLSALQMNNLAQLPSKQELLAKLVGSISAPMSGMINVIEGNLRSLVYILKNLKPQSQSSKS